MGDGIIKADSLKGEEKVLKWRVSILVISSLVSAHREMNGNRCVHGPHVCGLQIIVAQGSIRGI